MDKTILVFGSVTAEQYQEARKYVHNSGHKPKIIRPTDDDFNFGFRTIVAQHLRDEPLDEFSSEVDEIYDDVVDNDELACRLTMKYLEARFGNIVGIVVSDDMYDFVMGYGTYRWVVTEFGKPALDAIPLWRVHNNNYIEFIKP